MSAKIYTMEEKNDSKGAFAQPLLAKQVIIRFLFIFDKIQHFSRIFVLFIYFCVVKMFKFPRCFDLACD
jgi:hypothetical protein